MIAEMWRAWDDPINENLPFPVIPKEHPHKGCDNETDFRSKCSHPFEQTNAELQTLPEMRDDMEEDKTFRIDSSCHEVREDREEMEYYRNIDHHCEETVHNPILGAPDAMMIDCESKVKGDAPKIKMGPSIAWHIEAFYNRNRRLCFKLKMPCGAYMILYSNEIINSIKAILDETTGTMILKLRSVEGHLILLESSQVLVKLKKLIKAETRKRRLVHFKVRNDYYYGHGVRVAATSINTILRMSSRRSRGVNRCLSLPKRTRRTKRLSSAWKAISTSRRIQPPSRIL